MVSKWDITIPELTGDEVRSAYVFLPESYYDEPDRRYPVLYMFDGHNLFFDDEASYGKSWGMKEYMEGTDTQMIVAAAECNHSPDNGRLREYSPFTFRSPEFGSVTGLGEITMDWMVSTFKEEIDHQFRTLPERECTFIGGSSMGGLMSLYAVLKYNHIFSRAAALSPSLWVAPKRLLQMIDSSPLNPDTIVYMDYGSLELANHQNMRSLFGRVANRLLMRHVMINARIVPGGEHCEACWEKQIPYFMNTLLYEQ